MEVNFPKTKHSKMEKPKLPVSSGPRPRQSQNQVCCRAVGKQSLSLFRFKWRSEDTISPLEDGRESLWPSLILFYIERILFTPSTTEKPWVRKIPWRRECPLQYSCLENPMDSRAWWATVYGATKSQTHLKWLSIHMCTTRTHTKLTEGKISSAWHKYALKKHPFLLFSPSSSLDLLKLRFSPAPGSWDRVSLIFPP